MSVTARHEFPPFSSSQYLKQMCDDLARYSRHAGRRTITLEDAILLLKRQRNSLKGHERLMNDEQSFEYLVNSYLPMEYAEELLPSRF